MAKRVAPIAQLCVTHANRRHINGKRFSQLEAAKPKTIVVSCPFCMTMIEDAVKSHSSQGSIVTLDRGEVVAKSAGIR